MRWPHDRLAADVSLVGERIVGERRNALLEHVVDDRARQLHFARRLAVLGAHRDHVDGAGLGVAHQDRGAIAAGHIEDRLHDRIEQRFDARRARQDVRHLVQRRQVLLRRLEQVRFVLALVDLRQEFELGRIDGALHQRVAARFDDAERGRAGRNAGPTGVTMAAGIGAARSRSSRCGSCRPAAARWSRFASR